MQDHFGGQQICLWTISKTQQSPITWVTEEAVVTVTHTWHGVRATCGNHQYTLRGTQWVREDGVQLKEAVGVWNELVKQLPHPYSPLLLSYAATCIVDDPVNIRPKGHAMRAANGLFRFQTEDEVRGEEETLRAA